MRSWIRSVMVVLVLMVALSALAAPTEAKTYKLTVTAGHPPVFAWVSAVRDIFVPEVDRRLAEAGGKYKIEWTHAYGGTVAKIGNELDTIGQGISHLGIVGSLFEAAKLPLSNVSYMAPFTNDDILTVVQAVDGLRKQVTALDKEWERNNVVPLAGFGMDTYCVMSNFPIKTVDDLKGHKIAAPGPAANWLRGTGAVGVAGNVTTYYNDIKAGVYDGTLTFMSGAALAKLHEVAPYILRANIGAQYVGALCINKDVFDSFPPEVQKIFLEAGDVYTKKVAEIQTERAQKSLQSMIEGGAKVVTLSFDERKRWADMLPDVAGEWAKEMDKKGLPGTQTVKGFMEELRKRGTKFPRDWDK